MKKKSKDSVIENTVSNLEKWKDPCESAAVMESFFDIELIRQWSIDLEATHAQPSHKREWSLLGRGLIIETEDVADGQRLLRRAAWEAGFNTLWVPASECAEVICDALRGSALSQPFLVILNVGSWVTGEDEVTQELAKRWRVWLSSLPASGSIVFGLCTNKSADICSEFRKLGAFDRTIRLHKPTAEYVGKRFATLMGSTATNTVFITSSKKIGLILNYAFEGIESQEIAAMSLKRLAKGKKEPVNVNDLTDLTLRGIEEFSKSLQKIPSELSRRRTALHEAGHACISVIESSGHNIPQYASITPALKFDGIVLQSLSFYETLDDWTFSLFLQRIRIALAGRAAEELYFGTKEVTTGASSDLENATLFAFRLFAHVGFHAGMQQGESSRKALAVLPKNDINQIQYNRIFSEVQNFLAAQYDEVMKTLNEYRDYVEAVADRLLWDTVIDEDEMTEISIKFKIPVNTSA